MPKRRKKRQTFTAAFKAEAIALVVDQGVGINQAARDLGIPATTLSNWVRKAKAERESEEETVEEAVHEELRRLRREVRILREERDILKKAAAFFAKENR